MDNRYRMHRYRLFCSDLAHGIVHLAAEESHHAVASLRLKPGREVVLFNGSGKEAVGIITRAGRRAVSISVQRIDRRPFELFHRITLAVAMTRTHRQGFLIEKCTELGVAAIRPIISERSVSKPGAEATTKWSRRAIEAAKQSGRAWVPHIAAPQTLTGCLATIDAFDAACWADVGRRDPRSGSLGAIPFLPFLAAQPQGRSLLVLIGPEGGWSDDERSRATQAGAVPISLGPTVLRTETAAVTVCAAAALHDVASRAEEAEHVGQDRGTPV